MKTHRRDDGTRPEASLMPLFRALPYPLTSWWITFAPAAAATSADLSVDPLSTTTTCPETFILSNDAIAFRMHIGTVLSSLRDRDDDADFHGICGHFLSPFLFARGSSSPRTPTPATDASGRRSPAGSSRDIEAEGRNA